MHSPDPLTPNQIEGIVLAERLHFQNADYTREELLEIIRETLRWSRGQLPAYRRLMHGRRWQEQVDDTRARLDLAEETYAQLKDDSNEIFDYEDFIHAAWSAR